MYFSLPRLDSDSRRRRSAWPNLASLWIELSRTIGGREWYFPFQSETQHWIAVWMTPPGSACSLGRNILGLLREVANKNCVIGSVAIALRELPNRWVCNRIQVGFVIGSKLSKKLSSSSSVNFRKGVFLIFSAKVCDASYVFFSAGFVAGVCSCFSMSNKYPIRAR